MPRYYFHVTNGETTRDQDGDLFESVEEAKRHAVTIARELGHASSAAGARRHVCVTDEEGKEVFRTPI
jgi:hypothetical protein